MVLDLSRAQERESRRLARPEDHVNSAVWLERVSDSARLETHRIESLTDKLLKLVWRQSVKERRIRCNVTGKAIADTNNLDSNWMKEGLL